MSFESTYEEKSDSSVTTDSLDNSDSQREITEQRSTSRRMCANTDVTPLTSDIDVCLSNSDDIIANRNKSCAPALLRIPLKSKDTFPKQLLIELACEKQ